MRTAGETTATSCQRTRDEAVLSPGQPATLVDVFGDRATSALADVVLALATEVFELRAQLTRLTTPSVSIEELDHAADQFAGRVLAPLLRRRVVSS